MRHHILLLLPLFLLLGCQPSSEKTAIDRIRIDWDKVSEDSYLTRIPAIGLLQELAFREII